MVFNTYWKSLFKQAFKKLQDEDLAKDLVQDVFVCWWDNIIFLYAEGSVLAYLFAVLRNKLYKLFAKDEIKLRYINSLYDHNYEGENQSLNILLEKELKAIVDLEISKMPPRMQKIYQHCSNLFCSNLQITACSPGSKFCTFPASNNDVAIKKLAWAPDSDERERIDIIYYYPNKKLSLKSSNVVGPKASIVKSKRVDEENEVFLLSKDPWPSDHKGILTIFKLKK